MNVRRKLQRRQSTQQRPPTFSEFQSALEAVRLVMPVSCEGDVGAFCQELSPGAKPVSLTIAPVDNARVLDCFNIVEKHVANHGGAMAVGWSVTEIPGVLLEAKRHAVWRSPEGELRDITPRSDGATEALFVEDPGGTYLGKQVPSRLKPVVHLPELDEHIDFQQVEFEFMNRGARAEQHGAIRLVGEEVDEWESIRRRKATILYRLGTAILKFQKAGQVSGDRR